MEEKEILRRDDERVLLKVAREGDDVTSVEVGLHNEDDEATLFASLMNTLKRNENMLHVFTAIYHALDTVVKLAESKAAAAINIQSSQKAS